MNSHGNRTVPLYPERDLAFAFPDGETNSIINAESIDLVEPVSAKTLTLWYEKIWAAIWTTNVDKEAVTISHGGFSKTEIPANHGSVHEFFMEVKRPEPHQPPIEWSHQKTSIKA